MKVAFSFFLREEFGCCTVAVCDVYRSGMEALMGKGVRLWQDMGQVVKDL